MPLYAIITLLSAVVILLAGFRIYLMERNNAAYQAFGLVCVNLSWMCFCWYEMEQTGDLATAQFYRKLQFVWALNNPLLVYGSWRLAGVTSTAHPSARSSLATPRSPADRSTECCTSGSPRTRESTC